MKDIILILLFAWMIPNLGIGVIVLLNIKDSQKLSDITGGFDILCDFYKTVFSIDSPPISVLATFITIPMALYIFIIQIIIWVILFIQFIYHKISR